MALEAGGSSPLAHPDGDSAGIDVHRDGDGAEAVGAFAFMVGDAQPAPVAQLAEQGTLNPKVEGSIPSGRITSDCADI